MARLPSVKSEAVLAALAKAGFQETRRRGSHARLWDSHGRVVTVPVHPGQDIGRGLLRKILRDAEITLERFLDLL